MYRLVPSNMFSENEKPKCTQFDILEIEWNNAVIIEKIILNIIGTKT